MGSQTLILFSQIAGAPAFQVLPFLPSIQSGRGHPPVLSLGG
jgi:hypothetical protein